MTKLEKLWGDPGKSARDLAKNQRSQELLSSNFVVSLEGSTRVLVRPIGLDMVEVGSSNPPGPTKTDVSYLFLRNRTSHSGPKSPNLGY